MFSVLLLAMSSFAVADIRVDENFNFDDENPYNPNATFLGNEVEFLDGCPVNCTLEDSSGEVLGYATSPYGAVDTSNASAGRAVVYNTSDSSQNVSIDLFSESNDVVGRFKSGDLSLYYWRNGSEISQENPNFNWSTSSWGDDENVYRLNFTGDRKYFLGVNKTEEKDVVKSTKGYLDQESAPRINDFNLSGFSNITGNVYIPGGTSVSNLKLKLSQVSAFRFPYFTAPPTKYTYTDSSGDYRFTGLQSDTSYKIEVVNRSYHRYPFKAYNNTPEGLSSDLSRSTEHVKDLEVTSAVGNASVKLLADEEPNTSYGVYAASGTPGSYDFTRLEPGIEPGKYVNMTLPADNYTIIALKVDYGGLYDDFLTDSVSVEVQEGQESVVETGFPDRVNLTGTVKDDEGSKVSDIQVIARNTSLGVREYTRTQSDGGFSLKVQNDTDLTLTAYPGFGSSYKSNSTNITVEGSTEKNLTVSTGPYIEGYINDTSGNTLEGIEVSAWNGTTYSRGSDTSTENGYFRIGGLETDTVYEISVYEPGYPYKELDVNLTGQNESRNITLQDSDYQLSGDLHDSEGNDVSATVTLRNRFQGFENSKTVTGSYSFSDLDRGSYTVNVDPENITYGDKREYVYLDSDRTLDFEIEVLSTLEGKVKGSGGQGLGDVLIYAYNYSEDSYDSDRTDSEGDYRLDISPVEHEVEIWPGADSNYRSESTSVTASAGTSQKDFTLSKGSYLAGSVSDPGVENFSGFISLYNSSQDAYSYTSFSDGEYNITGLKDVGYNAYVYVRDSDYSSKTFSVDSSELDGSKDFTFGANQGPELRVIVQNPSGSRIANTSVLVEGDLKSTDLNGVANFGEQPDDQEASISVRKEGYNTSTADPVLQTTESVAGTTKTIEIYNQTMVIENVEGQLVDISVNLTDSEGTVDGATVVARSTDEASSLSASAVTDSEGNATLEGLLPGKKYLTSLTVDGSLSSGNVTFDSGEENVSSLGSYELGYEVPEN